MNQLTSQSHSADVKIVLDVNGQQLRVARIRGGVLVLRDRCEIPPSSDATAIITVDGVEDRLPIVLTHGISPESETV